jgi:hypothetical protein
MFDVPERDSGGLLGASFKSGHQRLICPYDFDFVAEIIDDLIADLPVSHSDPAASGGREMTRFAERNDFHMDSFFPTASIFTVPL